MAPCNMQIMMRFSCDELREKRRRAQINVAEDQRDKRRIEAEIRAIEIRVANLEAQIDRIRRRPPEPVLPGPFDPAAGRKPRKPSPLEPIIDIVGVAAQPIRDQIERRRLEGRIRTLEARLPSLRRDLWDRQERLNEMIAARSCINQAIRAKGCAGA